MSGAVGAFRTDNRSWLAPANRMRSTGAPYRPRSFSPGRCPGEVDSGSRWGSIEDSHGSTSQPIDYHVEFVPELHNVREMWQLMPQHVFPLLVEFVPKRRGLDRVLLAREARLVPVRSSRQLSVGAPMRLRNGGCGCGAAVFLPDVSNGHPDRIGSGV